MFLLLTNFSINIIKLEALRFIFVDANKENLSISCYIFYDTKVFTLLSISHFPHKFFYYFFYYFTFKLFTRTVIRTFTCKCT